MSDSCTQILKGCSSVRVSVATVPGHGRVLRAQEDISGEEVILAAPVEHQVCISDAQDWPAEADNLREDFEKVSEICRSVGSMLKLGFSFL